MISNILAAFAAIPKILDAINRLVAAVEKANLMAYMRSASETRKEILDANTKEEYEKVAKKLHDLIART